MQSFQGDSTSRYAGLDVARVNAWEVTAMIGIDRSAGSALMRRVPAFIYDLVAPCVRTMSMANIGRECVKSPNQAPVGVSRKRQPRCIL